MKKLFIIGLLTFFIASLAYAEDALYRISSGEVEVIGDTMPLYDTTFKAVLTDPTFSDGVVCRDPSGELRVLGYAKINDNGTVRNATQNEIDGFAAAALDDRNQAQAAKALKYLNNNPEIRRIVKALSAAFIEYEFNKTRALFRDLETQLALATSLANLQTRWAAVFAAHPMPDRTLSQLFNVITGSISKDD